ncbi:MAG: TnpV protein [Oscillospiraceae bacterium]|nr:TnpV protein [Oscillospiraceae bacterium]
MSINKSSLVAENPTTDKYIHLWKLDTESATVIHYDDTTGKTKSYTFHTDYIKYHVHYVAAKHPERFQKLVDDGTILDYLNDLEERAVDAVERQVERWKQNDKEYQLAVMNGDTMKQLGLLNNMSYMAREIIFDCMIYV